MRTNLVEHFPTRAGYAPVAVAVAVTVSNMDNFAGPITDSGKFALVVDSNCSTLVVVDESHFVARDWRQAVNFIMIGK